MSEACQASLQHHSLVDSVLTYGLCCGLLLVYALQYYKIISNRSSEGLSPLYLFFGTASCTSLFFNMAAMQWGIMRCCQYLSFGKCIDISAGVIQLGLQWAVFGLIMVLFMIYYPTHLKFVHDNGETVENQNASSVDPDRNPVKAKSKTKSRTTDWKLSIILGSLALVHMWAYIRVVTQAPAHPLSSILFRLIVFLTTLILLIAFPPPSLDSDIHIPSLPVLRWAGFLGITGAIFDTITYLPQIYRTYTSRLVGTLSIPAMCLQLPGAVLMAVSIVLRPGTNWTNWMTFVIAAICQSVLFVLCIMWKRRQRKLEIDDFGNPVPVPRVVNRVSVASSYRDSGVWIWSLYGAGKDDCDEKDKDGDLKGKDRDRDSLKMPSLPTLKLNGGDFTSDSVLMNEKRKSMDSFAFRA
ncbi:hypothetical protein D9758_005576 [Tetrapyrgos nigripes]|uniref:Uncharacterized protein n=1 Tax=Tetrapyrgos nigripes TaxID=182062 RepID=A0A8H5GH11_9AGAR|nr:hypothetical protein D9758_005576 [Tetrapyrgos nigripes]